MKAKTEIRSGRDDCHRRSAELHSAVPRICNPPGVRNAGRFERPFLNPLPNAIRRYGRFKICAVP